MRVPEQEHCRVLAHHPVVTVHMGDLLVRPDSAVGDTGDGDRLAFGEDAVCRLTGLHHSDLVNDPGVYDAIRTWLTGPPEQDTA